MCFDLICTLHSHAVTCTVDIVNNFKAYLSTAGTFASAIAH